MKRAWKKRGRLSTHGVRGKIHHSVFLTLIFRCYRLVFFLGNGTGQAKITELSPKIVYVHLPAKEMYHGTWQKVVQGIRFVHEQYMNEFDWLLRADDDTFMIMENLALFLSTKDATAPGRLLLCRGDQKRTP